MEPLAVVAELAARLPFVMDPDEIREAEGALEDLSDDARHYGSVKWLTPESAPRQVKNMVLRAAVRHMKNYEGYTVSRAGDESVSFSDKGENAGSAHFTSTEIERLGELGGYRRTGFHTINTFAYTNAAKKTVVGLVPDAGSNEPIHMFANEYDPY